MKFVDLLLYSETGISDFEELYTKHRSNLDYLAYLPEHVEVTAIQHAAFSGNFKKNKVAFRILRSGNRRWRIPFSLFFWLRKFNPDVILVHSMIFSWQIIFLGLIKKDRTRILIQNHAERPGGLLRTVIEKLAARCIDGFLFVSVSQAEPWIKAGIIPRNKKIFEVMEGSTYFTSDGQVKADNALQFLWVGRLNTNKDPLTILRAFNEFVKAGNETKLKMIFNNKELLSEVKDFIARNVLEDKIELHSDVPHPVMPAFYSQAHYFLLGSHHEGSGYALCEAMACGCVPIVTAIPSFSAMVRNGHDGFLFNPGKQQELLGIMMNLSSHDHEQLRLNVLRKFENELSFKAIGRKMGEILKEISSEKES